MILWRCFGSVLESPRSTTYDFMENYRNFSLFIILIPTPDFPHFYYMLGGNLGSLLYGDVSVMICQAQEEPKEITKFILSTKRKRNPFENKCLQIVFFYQDTSPIYKMISPKTPKYDKRQ